MMTQDIQHRFLILLIGFAVLAVPIQTWAEEESSPELLALGKEIFHSTQAKLGAKFNCILCHQKEKAISKEKVTKLGDRLPEVINLHLLEKSKGKQPLAKDSREMKALVAYLLHEHSV